MYPALCRFGGERQFHPVTPDWNDDGGRVGIVVRAERRTQVRLVGSGAQSRSHPRAEAVCDLSALVEAALTYHFPYYQSRPGNPPVGPLTLVPPSSE